jgi:tetratricopeptide (TPR) repeat protein
MMAADLTTVSQHRQAEPPKLIREVRGDLDWIVMKALEKDRARRYPTANGLALDVQRFLASEPISARPPSRLYRLQKSILRNKLLFGGIGAILTLLVVGLGVVTWLLAREKTARRDANTARVQAVADKTKASAEAAKSAQVTRFLEDMLEGVGPSVALGRDTTMLREMLNRTAERVGKEMTNQPAVEAELRSLIGTLYLRVGNFDQAEKMHRAALAIYRRLFGPESPQAATSLNDLGLALMAKSELSEAEGVDREALAIRRRLLGNENADTATSLNDLSSVYRQEGRPTEAEAMAREALAIRRRLFGNEHLEVADSLRNLSIILGDESKWAEAEAMAREVLAMRRKLLGPEHPWVASALDDVAWAAGTRGKLDEAASLEQEALAMKRKLLPEEHPDVAKSLYLVGDRMRQQGNLNEAYSVLSAALSIQRKLLGEDNPGSLDTLRSLGLTLGAEGKLAEAEKVHRESVALWRKRGESETPQALYALRDLGSTLEGEGKWVEAETVHRETLTLWRKRAGNEDPQTLYTLSKLGLALAAQRKWAEAETVHREALALWRKRAGDGDPQTLYEARDLGSTLEGEGKLAEAESVHREALASWRKRAGNEDPQTVYELERLTHVLMAQKKFGDAEQLLDEALTPAFARQPPSANLLALKADLKARRGQWQEAAADAALALEHQPFNPRYAMVAALFIKSHNRPAYEQLCKRLLTMFANTTDIYVADQVAKSCLFLPPSDVDLKLVGFLADLAVTRGTGDQDAMPFYQDCKALSEYRRGHYAEAVEWAEKPLKIPGIYVHGHAYAVLAMAYWRLGEKDEARAMLAKGDTLAPPIIPLSIAEDPGNAWLAWLYARIQLDEATALIKPGSTTDNNSNPP